jgi:hypothetical protein
MQKINFFRRSSIFRSALFFLLLLFSAAAHANVIVYPQTPGLQGCQFAYTVKAKDHAASTWSTVALYNAQVTLLTGGSTNTTVGNFDCSGSTDIQITFSTTVTSAVIGPATLNITPTISGNTITFTISGPQKFYVDINGNHYNNCIHILANPIEVNPPQPGDSNVVFIATGTYQNTPVTLTSGQTLYIQGGAAVAGVYADNVTNVKILGRGFIWRASFDAISAQNSNGVTIDGIIDLNHGWGGGGGCGLRCGNTNNLSISNTASFSSKKWGDGYDIMSSNNITVSNVFMRTNDDAITVYGGGKDGFTGGCKNVTITNSTLLPDLAQPLHFGVYGDQNFDTEIRDVTVANVDICDWSRSSGRPVIYFTIGDRVRAANFKFSNVRTYGNMASSYSKSFIGIAIVYNGTYNWAPGRAIDSVYFTNCSYKQSGYTPGSSINGYDANRRVTNVFFQNLTINDTLITSAAQGHFNIGGNATNVSNFSALGLTTGATYKLTAKHSGKCADVNGGSTSDGAQVIQYTYSGANNQKWVMEDAGNGFYKFKSVNSGKYLDINGASAADGANAIQYTSNTGLNQQFLLIPQTGGYYSVMARHSGKCIDVAGGSTSNGANVIQSSYSGSDSQAWLFENLSGARMAVQDPLTTQTMPRFAIYPNPVANMLYVSLPGINGATIKIYNLQGQLIMGKKMQSGSGTVNLKGLSSGTYVITIDDGEKQLSKKIIKM